ncbi:hypothetical protein BLI708_10815 [Bifidobacterium imperatoris]|uniref:CTP synthase n=1 Tax=Bifidobacterium imperatoris TaxID=2020965 RepID=A0ABX7S726_9BIFI|nr:hypothetical protein BLI708_10815 [Bifidobacterium imperatoris]
MNTYRGSPSLYAEQQYWNALTPPDQTLHIAKALAIAHPNWVFGGLVAASAYGFEHQWCLHDGSVSIMTQNHGSEQRHPRLKRVYMPQASSLAMRDSVTGLLLAPPAHTLIECARTYDFRFALPFFDSAFAQGISSEQVLTACSTLRTDCTPIFRLLQQANSRSENGGESLMRGTIYEEQFVMPRIQVPVKDPQTGTNYRVDFVWRLDDGRIIVAEYDGTEKYINPDMTNNRSIQQVVAKERERDAGLHRAGASDVVHLSFSEVYDRIPLRIKLLKAGIPLRSN